MRAIGVALLTLAACGGRTADTSDAAVDASCGSGLVACGASCVDLQTDDANCGGCGLACSTACTAGRCIETIATGIHAVSIATDGSYVYWSDVASAPICTTSCSTIQRAPVGGGAATTLAVTDPAKIVAGPFADSNDLVWMTDQGTISKIPLAGGSASTVVTGGVPPAALGGGVVVYGTASSNSFSLAAMPTSGGGASTPVVTFGKLSWPMAVATDGALVFYAAYGEGSSVGSIFAAPIAPDATSTSIWTGSGGSPLAVDSSSVYFATGTDMEKVARGGGTPSVLAPVTPSALGHPTSLAIDGSNMYFNDPGTDHIERVPLDGGLVTTLAATSTLTQSPGGHAIAVDAKSAYWTTGSAILKVTPK